MKTCLLISFLLFTGLASVSQLTETIQIPAGTDIIPAISTYGVFRFPAFAYGTVYFKDGSQDKAHMNYNIPNDQVVYIDQNNDTLAIAFPEQIAKITMGGTSFYYQKKGYMEELAAAAAGSLAMKRTIRIHAEKKGAFGMPDATSSIDSYATYNFSNASYPLQIDENIILTKTTAFFLVNSKNRLLAATRENFLQLFPHNKKRITEYINNNKTDFNRQQDLVQLFDVAAAPR